MLVRPITGVRVRTAQTMAGNRTSTMAIRTTTTRITALRYAVSGDG